MVTDRTWVQVNISALRHNYRVISEYCKKPIIAIVKADAYGHGAVQVAKALVDEGAPVLAVACIGEAKALREAGIEAPILILGVTFDARMGELEKYNLIQCVPSVSYAKLLAEKSPNTPVHIKVDTGMGRLGVKTADEVCEIAKMLNVVGIFTHFAESDSNDLTYTNEQMKKFDEIIDESGIQVKCKHVANSAATLFVKDALEYDAVRPGLILYGVYPDGRRESIVLKPAMSLFTRVCDVREIKKGESISYGRTFTADKDMKVAVLPIGYADGLPRGLSSCGKFCINGKVVPILGRVCMDLCMVDVSDCDARVGDIAELFGENISVDDVANTLETISYEICTGIAKRVPRVYINE